jgi:mannosyl-oligosaccharide alpha-1,2-mannosidase
MGFIRRRLFAVFLSVAFFILAYRQLTPPSTSPTSVPPTPRSVTRPIKWEDIPQRYPVSSIVPLPSGTPVLLPSIQHAFGVETEYNKKHRLQRQAAVKDAFIHSWSGYRKHAWLQDEVMPVSASFRNTLGNRGATLVDSLDTLLIMGLHEEFRQALRAVKNIDFSTSAEPMLNVFETNIRYLGGLLSAYDLSEKRHQVLLKKAVELGNMLYRAFDTPNRLPVTRWNWQRYASGGEQQALTNAFSAEIGTLSLEFTRLSQLTGDPKYYDAVQRISDLFADEQNKTSVPGLFPITLSPAEGDFSSYHSYSFGGCADSLYEYFLKEHILLGGLVEQYRHLYEHAMDAAKEHLFFRPLNPKNLDILVPGSARKTALGRVKLDPEGQQLACFTGGMVAIGAKVFNNSDDLEVARKLVNGCIWASDATPTGIMPERFHLVPCEDPNDCVWDAKRWHEGVRLQSGENRLLDLPDMIEEDGLRPSFTKIADKRYLLRYAVSSTH